MQRSAADIVTVVIPVHNRAEVVGDTLRSLAAQTALPSVVLVDNNSTDRTFDVLRKWAGDYNRPATVLTEMTPGAPAARNRGLECVTTPYVMFFDSDDVMSPGHIERVVNALAGGDLDIVGWDVDVVYLDGSRGRLPFADRDMWFRHTFNAVLSTQRYAVRTSLVHAVGAWNVGLSGWNDYELGFRLLAANPVVRRLDGQPTVLVRRQCQSITGRSFSSAPGRWEASLKQCFADVRDSGPQDIASWLRLRWAVLAAHYAREGAMPLADAAMTEALDGASCRRRLLLRLAYVYTRRGLRGIHRILRPLL